MDTTEYINKAKMDALKETKERHCLCPEHRLVLEKYYLEEEYLMNINYSIMDIKNNDIVIR